LGDLLEMTLGSSGSAKALLAEDGAEELGQSDMVNLTTDTSVGVRAVVVVHVQRPPRVHLVGIREVIGILGSRTEGYKDVVARLNRHLGTVILVDGIGGLGHSVHTRGARQSDTLHRVSEKQSICLLAGRLGGDTPDLVKVRLTFRGQIPVKGLSKLLQC
jgi:hypothetical protein